MGVVAGATRAFGRQTQGVWGAGPPTTGGELSDYQALKPPQIPAEVQSEPHLPSDVVLGQLVTERIGLENGIVLSFSS